MTLKGTNHRNLGGDRRMSCIDKTWTQDLKNPTKLYNCFQCVSKWVKYLLNKNHLFFSPLHLGAAGYLYKWLLKHVVTFTQLDPVHFISGSQVLAEGKFKAKKYKQGSPPTAQIHPPCNGFHYK